MYKETHKRSIVKGISWRVIATTTTILIVYVFFGRLDLAIAAGMIETVLKLGLFWGHERVWQNIFWEKKKLTPFSLWFTGLPLSGKTTIADAVYKELVKQRIPLERIDSKDIRALIPDIGYRREDRIRHLYRVAHLIKTLQKNSISTVSSFVSPYQKSRQKVSEMVQNNIIVYVKADLETCKARDKEGKYAKALAGEYENFTGVSDVYEEPIDADIVIDTEKTTVAIAAALIVKFIKKNQVQ